MSDLFTHCMGNEDGRERGREGGREGGRDEGYGILYDGRDKWIVLFYLFFDSDGACKKEREREKEKERESQALWENFGQLQGNAF